MAKKKLRKIPPIVKSFGPHCTSEFIEVTAFASNLSEIATGIRKREVTVDSLKLRKLAKDDLLLDLEGMLDEIEKTINQAEQIKDKYHAKYKELITESQILIRRMYNMIWNAHMDINIRDTSKDIELHYKHVVRAYTWANEDWDELSRIAERLSIQAYEESLTKNEDRSIKLINFMKVYCDIDEKKQSSLLKSCKRILQRADKQGKIRLPYPVEENIKSGQSFEYPIGELKSQWVKYREVLPKLPSLK